MLRFLIRTKLYIIAVLLLLMAFGAGLNQLVLIANGDTFPVQINSVRAGGALPGTLIDDVHVVMTPGMRLKFLSDVFDFKDGLYSIGDGALLLGYFLWSFAPYVWVFGVIEERCARNSLLKQ